MTPSAVADTSLTLPGGIMIGRGSAADSCGRAGPPPLRRTGLPAALPLQPLRGQRPRRRLPRCIRVSRPILGLNAARAFPSPHFRLAALCSVRCLPCRAPSLLRLGPPAAAAGNAPIRPVANLNRGRTDHGRFPAICVPSVRTAPTRPPRRLPGRLPRGPGPRPDHRRAVRSTPKKTISPHMIRSDSSP